MLFFILQVYLSMFVFCFRVFRSVPFVINQSAGFRLAPMYQCGCVILVGAAKIPNSIQNNYKVLKD